MRKTIFLAAAVIAVWSFSTLAVHSLGHPNTQGGGQDKFIIYQRWNRCVESLRAEGDFETGLWPRLRDSIQQDPPEHVRSLDRQQILEELIARHEERLRALREMLKLERQ